MCRYAWHKYRDHFACFDCRKAFKYWQWEKCDTRLSKKGPKLRHSPRIILCPDCSRPMADMGLDFKAPPKNDLEAWQILKSLRENGFTFHGCGWLVGLKPPKTLRELPLWLAENRKLSLGESLLRKFAGQAAKG